MFHDYKVNTLLIVLLCWPFIFNRKWPGITSLIHLTSSSLASLVVGVWTRNNAATKSSAFLASSRAADN